MREAEHKTENNWERYLSLTSSRHISAHINAQTAPSTHTHPQRTCTCNIRTHTHTILGLWCSLSPDLCQHRALPWTMHRSTVNRTRRTKPSWDPGHHTLMTIHPIASTVSAVVPGGEKTVANLFSWKCWPNTIPPLSSQTVQKEEKRKTRWYHTERKGDRREVLYFLPRKFKSAVGVNDLTLSIVSVQTQFWNTCPRNDIFPRCWPGP